MVRWGYLIRARSVFVHQAGVCALESHCPWISFAFIKFNWTCAVPLLTAGWWTLGNTKKWEVHSLQKRCSEEWKDQKGIHSKPASSSQIYHIWLQPRSSCKGKSTKSKEAAWWFAQMFHHQTNFSYSNSNL